MKKTKKDDKTAKSLKERIDNAFWRFLSKGGTTDSFGNILPFVIYIQLSAIALVTLAAYYSGFAFALTSSFFTVQAIAGIAYLAAVCIVTAKFCELFLDLLHRNLGKFPTDISGFAPLFLFVFASVLTAILLGTLGFAALAVFGSGLLGSIAVQMSAAVVMANVVAGIAYGLVHCVDLVLRTDKAKFVAEKEEVVKLKDRIRWNKNAKILLQLFEKLEKEAPLVKFDKNGAAKDSAANDEAHVVHFELEKLRKAAACDEDHAKLAELVKEVKIDAKKLKVKK